MRLISKKAERKALIHLIGIARAIHTSNFDLWRADPEVYAFLIEAVAEIAYAVGGIDGMNAVRCHGFEFESRKENTDD